MIEKDKNGNIIGMDYRTYRSGTFTNQDIEKLKSKFAKQGRLYIVPQSYLLFILISGFVFGLGLGIVILLWVG